MMNSCSYTDLILDPLLHVTEVVYMVMKDLPPTGPAYMSQYAEYGGPSGEIYPRFFPARSQMFGAYRTGAALGGPCTFRHL